MSKRAPGGRRLIIKKKVENHCIIQINWWSQAVLICGEGRNALSPLSYTLPTPDNSREHLDEGIAGVLGLKT